MTALWAVRAGWFAASLSRPGSSGVMLPSSNRTVERVAHAIRQDRPELDICMTRVPYDGHPTDGYELESFRRATRLLSDTRPDVILWNATRGAMLGFDRFGLEMLQPDRLRLAALIGLLGIGFAERLVLSHDTVWCWRGRALALPSTLMPNWRPTHVFNNILPALREAGVSEAKITAMMENNPRRYFGGAAAAR